MLKPWVGFVILPLFAFANAGLRSAACRWRCLLDPVALGIAAGLFVGKQLGILLGAASLIGARRGAPCRPVPSGAALRRVVLRRHRLHHEPVHRHAGFRRGARAPVQLGVLVGSLLSALVGYLVLRFAPPRK